MGDCIFCKIVNGEIPCHKVWEDEKFLAFLDIDQKVKGHALVVPKKHFENILDFDESLASAFFDCIKKTYSILQKKFDCTGFNLMQNNGKDAEQVITHLHFHILPRKKDDGINLSDKT